MVVLVLLFVFKVVGNFNRIRWILVLFILSSFQVHVVESLLFVYVVVVGDSLIEFSESAVDVVWYFFQTFVVLLLVEKAFHLFLFLYVLLDLSAQVIHFAPQDFKLFWVGFIVHTLHDVFFCNFQHFSSLSGVFLHCKLLELVTFGVDLD